MINFENMHLKELKNKKFYLYGATKLSSYIIPALKELKLNIAGIIDRNPLRVGKLIKNVNTISSDQLDTIDKDSVIIIASTYFKSINSDINKIKNNFYTKLYFFKFFKGFLKNQFQKEILEIERDMMGLKKKISYFENKKF